MGKPVEKMNKLRKAYMKIAKELRYPDEFIERISEAQSENECSRILHTARNLSNNQRQE